MIRRRFTTFSLSLFSLYAFPAPAVDIQPIKHLFAVSVRDGKPLKHPSGAVVGKGGRIYVIDGVNNRVAVFNAAGDFLFDFGKGGEENGEFNFPLGITADRSGRIYVADSGNGRVQVFSPEGGYLYHIDLPKAGGSKDPDPVDVAVTESGKMLYIVDNDSHRIICYDLMERKAVGAVGGMDLGKKGFRWPFSMALDKEGYQYVVDVINTAVRVLSPDGRFTIDIGGWGVNRGQFFRPKGVAIDSRGRLYVSDSFLGVVQVFDREGKFLAVLADESGKMKKFITPARLYIDSNDRLFVTEMFANRISVYKVAP